METLSEYLARKSMLAKDFAGKVGVNPSTISRILSNQTKPRIELALKIQEVTKGRVSLKTWVSK